MMESAAGLDRLKHLEDELASVPVRSLRARQLSAAIRIEAYAYRKSLDAEQATATHDANPLADVGRRLGQSTRGEPAARAGARIRGRSTVKTHPTPGRFRA
jgi:hypothetical protein